MVHRLFFSVIDKCGDGGSGDVAYSIVVRYNFNGGWAWRKI